MVQTMEMLTLRKLKQRREEIVILNMWHPIRLETDGMDINKTFDQDTFLCFSATASNMLHWWMDQNRGYIDNYLNGNPDIPKAQEIKKLQQSPTGQHDSNIYDKFVEQFANRKGRGIGRIFLHGINLSMDIISWKTEERMTRSWMEKI